MLFTAHCSRTRSRSSALHPIQMHLSGRWRATTESRCESAVSDCRPSVRVVLLGTSTPKRSKGESETDGCVRVWSKKVDMTFRVESTLWDGRTDGRKRKAHRKSRARVIGERIVPFLPGESMGPDTLTPVQAIP